MHFSGKVFGIYSSNSAHWISNLVSNNDVMDKNQEEQKSSFKQMTNIIVKIPNLGFDNCILLFRNKQYYNLLLSFHCS